MAIERMRVEKSANVGSIGYDAETKRLHVGFLNSKDARLPERVYEYSNVPPEEHQALMLAPSKGSHVALRIKGRYPHRLLAPG